MAETIDFSVLTLEELSRILVENKEEISMMTKENKNIKKIIDEKIVTTKKQDPKIPIYVPPIASAIEPTKKYELRIVTAPRPPIQIPDVPRPPMPTLRDALVEYLRENGGSFGTVDEFIAFHDKYMKSRAQAIEEEHKIAKDRAIQEAQLRAAQEPEPETVYKTSIVTVKQPKEKKRKTPSVVFEGETKQKRKKKQKPADNDEADNEEDDDAHTTTSASVSSSSSSAVHHDSIGLF